ncbi:Bis(5'-nucleosyl)-tetraphosphatase (asymmetrical) [Evansella cellulosilytica DSM 2522]|uniref:Bis(5'-nucleosyl)-tetraphosphatase (Asymmetrical) n=1 Tax=Evansella cellulosilytica (strain ATCC 21833 / DSM 2522 / FERM P-1141 / JCM 9156 / N-4) TaxID=649639 RepID=E6TX52_EVAC2|nr:Bis(5'-nucleosyl)-tetraphosphatase (asymmetrical) [Evansella cellulosilytica DSM 2522]
MYDVIGDIHGCYQELVELLQKLGYQFEEDNLSHKDNRKPVFLGDLTDRGPDSISVIKSVCTWVKNDQALYCPGNHCNKLYRYFLGRNVVISHGLETTVAELEALTQKQYQHLSSMFKRLYEECPLYLQLDDGKLVVAHAGIRPQDIGKTNKSVKTFVLYGDITGEKHPDGRPVRRDWAKKYTYECTVVYGHTPVKQVRQVENTINIDTGCVFGNRLSALQWPEKSIVSVSSHQPFNEEKFHPIEEDAYGFQ